MGKKTIISGVILFLFLLFPLPSYSLPPGSGLFFHDAMVKGAKFNAEMKDDPIQVDGAWIFRKKFEGHPCTVLAVVTRNRLLGVTLLADYGVPKPCVADVLTTAFSIMGASKGIEQGRNIPPEVLETQFKEVLRKIQSSLSQSQRNKFPSGYYGINVETVSTENDYAVRLYF